MAFPVAPANGNIATVNGINYQYSNTTNSWTVLQGNVANLYVTTFISAGGNITGSYFIGNGSQLTGITSSGGTGTALVNGNTNITTALNSNANVTIAGTANVAVFSTIGVFQRGSYVSNWKTANTTPTGPQAGDQWYDNSTDKRYLYINDGTSNAWVDQSQTTSFSTLAVTGAATFGSTVGVTGNITGGNLTVGTGTITFGSAVNAGANGTGNIGSATGYFNTVFAKATSAQYADVAEWYASDAEYVPGTVVSFGGSEEITISDVVEDNTVAGVISSNPAYIMNAGINSVHKAAVALVGRVPTRVIGPVKKGNMMISAGNGYACACSTPAVGTVIGKAIENFNGSTGLIEIVVGRI